MPVLYGNAGTARYLVPIPESARVSHVRSNGEILTCTPPCLHDLPKMTNVVFD